MAAKPGNAINLNSTVSGLVNFDGTATFGTTALTQYYTLAGASNNTVNPIAPGTAGQVLTSGGASAYPSYQTVTFTEMPWTDKTTTFTPAIRNGYFVTGNATAVLPSSAAQSDVIAFAIDDPSAILTITGNTGQIIQVGKAISAAAGTCVSNFNGDLIFLTYRLSDTKWIATSVIGTWTVT